MASMQSAGWLQAGSAFIEIMGTLEQGKIAKIQADRRRVFAEFNEQEAEKQAGRAVAISQRQAREENRQGQYEASRALAVAAASGGGVSDPTIVRLIANTKGEGAYRASVALYEGAAKARQLRLQGLDTGFDDGGMIKAGYALATDAIAARTGMSLYAKYGMNGPGTKAAGSGDATLINPSNQG